MGIEFEFFKATNGDSILISTDNKTNILIDGGVANTYRDEITYSLDKLNGNLNLVVVTHIDIDHICGIIELLNDDIRRKKIKKLWFNMASDTMKFIANDGNEVGGSHGNLLSHFLITYEISYKNNIYLNQNFQENIFNIGTDIQLTLLSPTKDGLKKLREKWNEDEELKKCPSSKAEIGGENIPEDNRDIDDLYFQYKNKKNKFGKKDGYINSSSIAFILEYKTKKFLFLGDADIGVINSSLKKLGYSNEDGKRLKLEFVKLSHHVSQKNINEEFLNLIETDTFVVLTNGKHPSRSTFKHPDKETLMLILKHPNRKENIKFIFNYPLPKEKKFPSYILDRKRYNFRIDVTNTMEY